MVTCCWVCRRKINTQRETTKKPAITHTQTHNISAYYYYSYLCCIVSPVHFIRWEWSFHVRDTERKRETMVASIKLCLCGIFILFGRCRFAQVSFICKNDVSCLFVNIVDAARKQWSYPCLYSVCFDNVCEIEIYFSPLFFQFNHFNRSLNYYFVSQKNVNLNRTVFVSFHIKTLSFVYMRWCNHIRSPM